jgi:heterodisulfide reductase subunit B
LTYAYYPGCSLHAGAKEYDVSWQAVCERLDIELSEMADWSCCGTVHATSVDRTLSLALAARNLTIAEDMDLEIVAPCSGCYKNLRTADEALKRDAGLRAKINAGLPRPFEGKTRVRHPLYVLLQDVGLNRLRDVPRPLHGLKVAPYYGCVLTRPPGDHPIEDPEDPQGLDQLLKALGADVVPYPAKTKCCGGAVLLSHTDIVLDLTGRLLKEAKEAGAQCLAVACPMCQMALDAYQSKTERQLGERLDLPVLYFTQLMGLAMGVDERHLGLGRLFVSPAKVMAQI